MTVEVESAVGVYGEVGGVGEALLGEKEQIANFASTFEFAALILQGRCAISILFMSSSFCLYFQH